MHGFLKDNLEDYLQGRLSERDRARFESCMAESPEDCTAIDSMRSISASFRAFDLPEDASPAPSPGFYSGVMSQIAEESDQPMWNLFLDRRVMKRVAYASCAWLLLLGSTGFYQYSVQMSDPLQLLRPTSNYVRASQASTTRDYMGMILRSSPESENYCNVRLGSDLETNRSLMLAAVMVSGGPQR